MQDQKILEGKKLLIVDDEPEIAETLKDLLEMCDIDVASDFETGRQLLSKNSYDIAILDIMGVQGYDLLEIARQTGIPALMFTAHALSADNLAKSISQGAIAYIPKEKMADIDVYLCDLLNARTGAEKPHRWFARLEPFFDKLFGISETYQSVKKDYIKKYGPIDPA